MKLKLYSIIIILTLIFLSMCYYAEFLTGHSKKSPAISEKFDEIENIENLIIVDGLEMDSESSSDNNDFDAYQGKIIYDNTFDDDIIYSEIYNQRNAKSSYKSITNKNSSCDDNIITELKKKDKRWHFTEYKIKKGENLFAISRKYNTDHKIIIKTNRITNPDSLKTGKIILVPNRNGINYEVCKGDTITGITKKYKIEKNKIITHNNIKKDIIKTGDILFLPDIKISEENIVIRKIKYDTDSMNVSKKTFTWPLKGRITSAFGTRTDPITLKKKFHCGLDIGTDVGTPVVASADGRVIFSGWKKGYGRLVILKHKNSYITVYAHNSMNLAETGDTVHSGEEIALSGMSGAVTGSHLHFEIRKYLTPLNPMRFLR